MDLLKVFDSLRVRVQVLAVRRAICKTTGSLKD